MDREPLSSFPLLLLLAACGTGAAEDGSPARLAAHLEARAGVIYVWSPLMPLSVEGKHEVAGAVRELGIPLLEVDAGVLEGWLAEGDRPSASSGDSLARRLVAAGATVHFPAVLVHRDGQLLGPAIVGYNTADAYRSLIHGRLETGGVSAEPLEAVGSPPWSFAGSADAAGQALRDYPVPGRPGPYFRWVPGTRSVAYESSRQVYLLDLTSGDRPRAPGTIDFVPSPDGRIFVTPGIGREGLEFYDAREVLREAARGRGAEVRPLFTDRDMRDQYPSVGILRADRDGRRTTYRVLTSWFDAVVYRDYQVRGLAASGAPRVRPRGPPVRACPGMQVSLPIMTQDGRELGARDESTGTTKIFALGAGGTCREVLDLGLPTTKVAFAPDGRRVAFAVPPRAIRDGMGRPYAGLGGEAGERLHGVFVFDRDRRRLSRVHGSEEARRLTIPEWIGGEGVMFLLADRREGSRFRFVPLDEVR